MIRSIRRYDLLKIKPTGLEAEGYSTYDSIAYNLFFLKTRLLESQALYILVSELIGEREKKHCDWLVLLLLLPTPIT